MNLQKSGWLLVVLVVCVVANPTPRAQTASGPPAAVPGDIETVQVRPNVYMLVGGGANIVAHVGWMGIILIDSGSAASSDKVIAALQRITPQKVRYIINTTADADHIGGNSAVSRAGLSLVRAAAGGLATSQVLTRGAAGIMAHENVLNRMSEEVNGRPAYPGDGWPTEPFTGARVRSVYLNGDGIQVFYQPRAHSDADSIVMFRRADVIVSGPIIDLRTFPVIDLAHGGSIDGLIAALNNLVDMTIAASPMIWHDDRTLVIPSHGRVMDFADVVDYRDMVVVIRDRIADLIRKGMTIDQIIKADPTKGYREEYGPSTGPWTNEMFIRAVHRGLTDESETGRR